MIATVDWDRKTWEVPCESIYLQNNVECKQAIIILNWNFYSDLQKCSKTGRQTKTMQNVQCQRVALTQPQSAVYAKPNGLASWPVEISMSIDFPPPAIAAADWIRSYAVVLDVWMHDWCTACPYDELNWGCKKDRPELLPLCDPDPDKGAMRN
jgi:hypothetical protein